MLLSIEINIKFVHICIGYYHKSQRKNKNGKMSFSEFQFSAEINIQDFYVKCQHILNLPRISFCASMGFGDIMHIDCMVYKHFVFSLTRLFVCLFDLILYVPSTIFQLYRDGLPGLNQYLARINVSCSRTTTQ